MHFDGLRAFAMFIEGSGARLEIATAEAARLAAEEMAITARELYGKDPPLATLAESTQDERVQLGYSANEPLYRSGFLRNSVHPYATRTIAAIEITGEAGPIAAAHEYGYVTQPFGNPRANAVSVPPRPVFRYTIMAQRTFIGTLGGRIAKKAFGFSDGGL